MATLRRTATAALLSLYLALPLTASATDSIDPAVYLETATVELQALERLVESIPDWRLRRNMSYRIRNAALAIQQARSELTLRSTSRDSRLGYRDTSYRGHDAGYRPAISTISFQDAKTLVNREHFDSDKVDALRKIGQNGRFTTDEARALASLCTFDGGRRDALVVLYPSVTDKARYALALDILSFGSSKQYVRDTLGI